MDLSRRKRMVTTAGRGIFLQTWLTELTEAGCSSQAKASGGRRRADAFEARVTSVDQMPEELGPPD